MIGKKLLLNTSAIAIATAFLPGLVRADVTLDSGLGLAACLWSGATCGTTGAGFTSNLGDGGENAILGTNAVNGITTSGQSVLIAANGVWATPPAGSAWIGAVDSGQDGLDYVAQNLSEAAFQITSQSFTAGTNSSVSLDVWADDTADVYLNDLTTNTRVHAFTETPGQGVNCAPAPITCVAIQPAGDADPGQPGNGVVLEDLTFNHVYDLSFDVWQAGSGLNTDNNPTGLLYAGSVIGATSTNTSTVPEAGVVPTLLSMLLGVAAFAGIFKKKLA